MIKPIAVRIVRSSHLPTPIFKVLDIDMGVVGFAKFLVETWSWKILTEKDEIYSVQVSYRKHNVVLRLSKHYLRAMLIELSLWKKSYLPNSFSLVGRSVLDIGAGCGETAFFYLTHGAEKVICVEPDELAFSLLERNTRENGWNVVVIRSEFKPRILHDLSYDFVKMDCEGCESLLLDLETIPCEMVVEVHGSELMGEFLDRWPSLEKEWTINLPGSSQFDTVYGIRLKP